MTKTLHSCIALLLILPGLSWGHQQGSSYSHWQLSDRPEVSVRISELDLTRVQLHPQHTPNYQQQVLAYLQAQLTLAAEHHHCRPNPGTISPDKPGWVNASWTMTCVNNAQSWTLRSNILIQPAPNHLHFARWQDPKQQQPTDKLLTASRPEWQINLGQSETANSGFIDTVVLGIEHILAGWDHLAFVLGLLLLAKRQGSLWLLISGFTIGHSITLAAASLGLISPNIALIEATIAWTIALLASEIMWLHQPSWRWLLFPIGLLCLLIFSDVNGWLALGLLILSVGYFTALSSRPHKQAQTRTLVTLAFGLVHGCGFAAVLEELALPQARLATTLFGFNLGVEIGQIAVVLVAWPLLQWLQRHFSGLRDTLALMLLSLASYWWFLRIT